MRRVRLDVPVQKCAYAVGQRQRSQKLLIEQPPAGDVEACDAPSYGDYADRGAARQIDRMQKGAFASPRRDDPRLLVPETRGPLRRRNDLSFLVHQIEKIEALRGGHRRGLSDERRQIRIVAAHVALDPVHGFARREPIDPVRDVVSLLREPAAELSDERGGALAIERLERAARAGGDRDRHERDDSSDHAADDREETHPQRHGLPPCSHTSARSQSTIDRDVPAAAKPTRSPTPASAGT